MYQTPSGSTDQQRSLKGDCSTENASPQSVVHRCLAGRPSLIQQEQSEGCSFVFGVQAQDLFEAAALLFEVVCFGCPPERGRSHEGAATREVLHYEPSCRSARLVKHDVRGRDKAADVRVAGSAPFDAASKAATWQLRDSDHIIGGIPNAGSPERRG
jgi:hypothetical protein